jgi:hypothetical protein
MNRWEKLSTTLLRLVDAARTSQGAVAHMTSEFGRMCDTLDRLEKLVEETHASHQRSNRLNAETEARLTKLERKSAGGA